MGIYVDELTGRSVWELYRMANCGQPDGRESPGNRFLDDVRDDCIEHIRTDGMTPGALHDKAGELAGQAVYDLESRGTYRKWLTFTDLCGWQEDLSNLGYEYQPDEGLGKGADLALYAIAERLVTKIADEWEESLTDGNAALVPVTGVCQCTACN